MLEDGAGRDDADYLPFEDALCGLGVAELFAYGDAVSFFQQLRERGIERVGGNAGKWDAVAPAELLGCEGDAEVARDDFGVLAKGFVEITEAEQENAVRELGLYPLVLLLESGTPCCHRLVFAVWQSATPSTPVWSLYIGAVNIHETRTRLR